MGLPGFGAKRRFTPRNIITQAEARPSGGQRASAALYWTNSLRHLRCGGAMVLPGRAGSGYDPSGGVPIGSPIADRRLLLPAAIADRDALPDAGRTTSATAFAAGAR